MTNFCYISPQFPETNERFCVRLREAGVNVFGIGDTPYHLLTERLRGCLTEYFRVDNLDDYDEVFRAAAFLSFKHGKIDWVESNNEYWLPTDARLRDDFNVSTGFHTDLIEGIKSKSAMKPIYGFASIPTARQARVTDADGAITFAAAVGYPLVAKPEYGIGATDTARLNSDADARGFFARARHGRYVVEEFIDGEIVSYDAILDSAGRPVFEAATDWGTSIMDIVSRQLDLTYRILPTVPPELSQLGRRAAIAFGMRNRFVHEEFFRLAADRPGLGSAGDYVGLEVNMRPAGGYTLDMYNFARSADVYQVYADMVTGHDTGAAEKASRMGTSAVYASRRFGVRYKVSWSEIRRRYGSGIMMLRRNPPMFVPQMGNTFAVFRTDSDERAAAFARDMTERV